MQLVDQQFLYSASDLVKFLACRHLTQLDRERARGELERPPGVDGMLELLGRKGTEHEIA